MLQIQIGGNQISNQFIGSQQFIFQGQEIDPTEIKQALIDFVAANFGEEHAMACVQNLLVRLKQIY